MGDWGELGASIGRNTFIEEVDIKISQGDFERFARGFASNRSVKSLTIYCEALVNEGMLRALFPFFINNSALKSLHIMYADSTCLHVLASVLRQFDTLTEFALSTTKIRRMRMRTRMRMRISMKGMNSLRNAKIFPWP